MIGRLRGRLERTGDPSVVLVDVGGVGYRVAVPAGQPAGGEGHEVTLHTRLLLRDDQPVLFGFAAAREVALFDRLLGVGGVGPKVALAAIGALGADGLAAAVADGDEATIATVPGIGRKVAGRVVLELAGSLPADLVAGRAGAEGSAARAEAREALVALGSDEREAGEALRSVGAEHDGAAAEELVRAALRTLGGPAGVAGRAEP